MKITILYLCLVSTSCAILLRKPRRAGFGSKSEEMMQFGPYAYMNSPQLSPLAPFLYGYRPSYPQLFSQPLQRFYLWPQQTPAHQAARVPQRRPHQTPAARQPVRRPQLRPQLPQQPHKPIQQQPRAKIQLPPRKPPNTSPPQTHHQVPVHQPKGVRPQQPQVLFPNQQHLWHFPQMFGHGGFHPQPFGPFPGRMPAGFGRPPISNEEGTPYYGYGYPGLGVRPYNSEEFEQDYEKPKEKDAPNTESPAADPAINATDTNSTLSNPSSQAGNATNSGLSVTDHVANSPNLESRLLIGNGVPTLSPTVHVSKGNVVAQNVMDQSIHRGSSPNMNHVIQSLPLDKQQSTGNGLHVYKPYPGMEESRHSTFISRGNPSGHPDNPTYPSSYGENFNQRGNLQNINNNNPSINTRPNSYGQQEHAHYPERNPPDQRQTLPFPSSDPQRQWNNDPVYRENSINTFPPEGTSVDVPVNTIGQPENAYNVRKDTDQFQPSGMHQLSSLSPQGVFLPTKRTLSEAETHQYHWKERGFKPPFHEREQFPNPRNHVWNKQEDLQVFQDDPPRYNSRHSSGYHGQREHVSHPEKSSYDQPPRFFYPDTWEGRESSPTLGPAGQREHLLYPSAVPSNQVQRNSYHRSDSFVQQEREIYPKQTPWAHEKHLLDQDREYRNPPFNPAHQRAYPKYPPENPSNQRRGNVPYQEINPWNPEERSPPYATEHLRQTENIPYRRNNEFGHRERNFLNEGADSPPQSTTLLQGGSQYSERETWGPHKMGPSIQKEGSPYFNSYSPDFRRNPTHMEDKGGAHISSINVAERRNYPDRLGYPEDYPGEHRTIISYPSANRWCCAGDSSVPRENSLAPLRSAPQFRLASWEQRGSSLYPEAKGDHVKQASRTLYPSGMQSEQSPLNQRRNLGVFGEDGAGLEKVPPCSKLQVGPENGHEVNHETGLTPARDTPCYGRSIRGDGHSMLEQIIQPKREHEGAAAAKFAPQKGPPSLGIKSVALDSEGSRKEEQAVLGFKRIPCLVNRLKQFLSSTGAPPGDRQQDLFYAENPTLSGQSYIVLPEPHPLSSTDPAYDTAEKAFTPSSLGEDLADEPNERTSDCLLLQK
ncbi:enamelin [Paroedura picta]|uniref:enamelin n=1 Tax=Paroedura picta TaxID=143630 RepID=UPI0040560EC4